MAERIEQIAEGVTLYLGDCRDVLPSIPHVDAVVTDPPYGIAEAWKGGKGHGWGRADAAKSVRNVWDAKAPDQELIQLILSKADQHIIWGGNYFDLPKSRCWYVWNKPERGFTLAEAELAWTNKDSVVRVFDAPRSEPGREHPTQKPVALMSWCISKTSGVVLDPFMGSGTTGVACVMAGRPFLGIEAEPAYFEIAVRRISAASKQGDLFIEKPTAKAEQLRWDDMWSKPFYKDAAE